MFDAVSRVANIGHAAIGVGDPSGFDNIGCFPIAEILPKMSDNGVEMGALRNINNPWVLQFNGCGIGQGFQRRRDE